MDDKIGQGSNLSDLFSTLSGSISATVNSLLNQTYNNDIKVKKEETVIGSKYCTSVNTITDMEAKSVELNPCLVKIENTNSFPGYSTDQDSSHQTDFNEIKALVETKKLFPGVVKQQLNNVNIKNEHLDNGNENFSNSTGSQVYNYHKIHHNADRRKKQHRCTLCNEIFDRKFELVNHRINAHKDLVQPSKCVPCNKVLPTGRNFKQHFKNCPHGYMQKQIHSCQKCNNNYTTRSSLDQHIKQQHRDEIENPFSCSICGKSFRKQKILNFHISTHPELWQSCGICKRPFRRPTDLKKHIITHDNKVPYFCTICKLGFIEKNTFKKHKKQFHKKGRKSNDQHSYFN